MSELQKYEIASRDGDLIGVAPDGSALGRPPVAELYEGTVIYFADDADAARSADKQRIAELEAKLAKAEDRAHQAEQRYRDLDGYIGSCTV